MGRPGDEAVVVVVVVVVALPVVHGSDGDVGWYLWW